MPALRTPRSLLKAHLLQRSPLVVHFATVRADAHVERERAKGRVSEREREREREKEKEKERERARERCKYSLYEPHADLRRVLILCLGVCAVLSSILLFRARQMHLTNQRPTRSSARRANGQRRAVATRLVSCRQHNTARIPAICALTCAVHSLKLVSMPSFLHTHTHTHTHGSHRHKHACSLQPP